MFFILPKIHQPKIKRKKSKTQTIWKKKLVSFISFQKFLFFPIWTYLENAQCFVGALL